MTLSVCLHSAVHPPPRPSAAAAVQLVAERYLRASGLGWTIVRPGGLSNEPPERVGGLVVGAEDTLFGLPGEPGREVSRDSVSSPRLTPHPERAPRERQAALRTSHARPAPACLLCLPLDPRLEPVLGCPPAAAMPCRWLK